MSFYRGSSFNSSFANLRDVFSGSGASKAEARAQAEASRDVRDEEHEVIEFQTSPWFHNRSANISIKYDETGVASILFHHEEEEYAPTDLGEVYRFDSSTGGSVWSNGIELYTHDPAQRSSALVERAVTSRTKSYFNHEVGCTVTLKDGNLFSIQKDTGPGESFTAWWVDDGPPQGSMFRTVGQSEESYTVKRNAAQVLIDQLDLLGTASPTEFTNGRNQERISLHNGQVSFLPFFAA